MSCVLVLVRLLSIVPRAPLSSMAWAPAWPWSGDGLGRIRWLGMVGLRMVVFLIGMWMLTGEHGMSGVSD